MLAAHRAIRIFAQLEFPELHGQRIDQQQTSDERIPFAQDQLDDFRGLHHPYQTRKDAKHAAFGAGRHQAGRWRLRIKAAVARTIFGGKDTGLALKAEN